MDKKDFDETTPFDDKIPDSVDFVFISTHPRICLHHENRGDEF